MFDEDEVLPEPNERVLELVQALNDLADGKLGDKTTVVEMLSSWGRNVKGDICGFNDQIARQLIELGIAKEHKPKVKKQAHVPVDKMERGAVNKRKRRGKKPWQ
jgi:hypothetical protein